MFNLIKLFKRQRPEHAIAPALWQRVEAGLPWLSYLSSADMQALRHLAAEFLERKVFSGAQGFEPDNIARLSIALQACVPVLKLGLSAYDGWSGIVVYPGEFVIPRRTIDESGVVHEYHQEAIGEAWLGGPVILTWFDDPARYAGANVVIHEFAHKLDMLGGKADGVPPLHSDMSSADWFNAFKPAYEHFCSSVDTLQETGVALPLNPYAAEHPAEFFAVASEVFFTDPISLCSAYPSVYQQLSLFYRQQPLAR